MEPLDFELLKQNAQNVKKENSAFFKKLKKKRPKNLDIIVQKLDQKYFNKIDCLSCANCCRTLGPLILPKDIERISNHLRIKETHFIDKYLHIDEDNDYIFKSMPCPFLNSDNYCIIYEHRPKACREYPHTSQRRFVQKLEQTLHNTETCPAVYEIVQELKQKINI